jgi:energy-converting hydrogenase Eha subunit F
MTECAVSKVEIAFWPSESPILALANRRHAMFQRQTRRPFPAGLIFLLALAVLAILFFVVKSLNKEQPQNPPPPMEQTNE